MGIQLNGTSGTDVISAVDGSLTVEGLTISGDFNIADKIIHSGDTNTAIRFPAADTVSVETGGTERIRITSAGKLGIGTDNPAEELHLQGNTAVVALVESVGANDSRVRIKAPSDRISYLEFADDDADAGEIRYDHTDNYMAFRVNNNEERLRITSDGKVGINQDTPTEDLEVKGDQTATIFINSGQHDASTAQEATLKFGFNQSHANDSIGYVKLIEAGGNSYDGNMAFGVPYNNSGTPATREAFRIQYDGYVWLNKANPQAHSNIVLDKSASGAGSLRFYNAGSQLAYIQLDSSEDMIYWGGTNVDQVFYAGSNPRLRITAGGEVRIGDNTTTASTAGDDLVIQGSSDRGLSIISGTSSSGNIYFGDTDDADIGRIAYQHNDNAIDFSVNAASTRLRIHSSGITVYGNDNYFYGGGSGTNLNGDLKIRSTGTAVYQSLKFLSSDGSSQSQLLGYGGGAILFHYSNEFVWAINNQGERLNLTNTSLRPRDTNTVLDLGTTTRRYRRTYTNGITVNTSNTNTNFCINGGSSANVMTIRNTTLGNGNVGILFSTQDHSGGREKAAIYHQETHGQAHYGGDFIFCLNTATGGATQVGPSDEKMRITRHGVLKVGTTQDNPADDGSSSTAGCALGGDGLLSASRNANTTANFGRNDNDGRVLTIFQDGSAEGGINVSGSSVTLSGGSLTRWSQLVGISTNVKSDRPTIYQGTVMSNLDEMCVWVGEENMQLNKTQVSTASGDKNIAGVFWAWDDDDDTYVNDFFIAQTGDFIVRVGAATTVVRGDLLESAGDGTAKPQSDDIVRSKTVAKVSSGIAYTTYADGSKAYPCVLMAS